jgi:hypothetical protein
MNKPFLRIAAALVLSLGAFAAPPTALAGGPGACAPEGDGFTASSASSSSSIEILHMSTKGLSANAEFFSSDRATGTFTDVFLCAIKASDQPGSAFVTIFQGVKGMPLTVDAIGETDLPAGAFTINSGLTSAMLTATIPTLDLVSNTSFNVTVSADWTGVGSLTHVVSTFHEVGAGFTISGHSTSDERSAQTTGSVASSTIFFGSGMARNASLDSASSGEVDIFRS